MYRIFPLIFLTLVLCGCNLSSAAPVPVTTEDSAQPVRLQVAELTPTLSATATVTAAPKATASPAPLDRCAPAAERPIRLIQADVTIDYATKRTEVVQRIEFLNREESALAEIVLDVQANQWPESFWLNDVTVDEAPADYALEANRLQVALHSPLESGCWLEIGLGLTVQPAAIRDGLRAYRGFLGYSTRQLNLAHFLPTVAARLGGAWRIHKPIGIGEQVVHAVADWQVTVTALNAAETLQLAAPGLVNDMGAGKWEISLDNSRDFAISLSEDFVLTEQEITADLTIAVYAFADATINAGGFQLDGAQHAGQEAEKALELFGRQFGAYPRPRFVIVQGDFPDGMEFSGLVFVGSAWFYYFDGSPKNYLTLISVHEIAHQWWYARVGSDAALHPWLDEALATYSEYLFIEEFYPAEKNWWWTFRVASLFPQGQVDSAVYEFRTPREYINAIYLRGVQMLQNLREDIGDAAFFELLRNYRQAGEDKIADPTLFWSQLAAEQRPLTQDTRQAFLSDPTVDKLFSDAP